MQQSWHHRASHELYRSIAALVVGTALICAGCGAAGTPPPEAPPAEIHGLSPELEAPPAEIHELSPESADHQTRTSELGGAKAAPPDGGSNHKTQLSGQANPASGTYVASQPTGAAQVRLYLARHKIYRPWYPQVGEIELDGSVADIGTTLPQQARAQARQVCTAVLESGFVDAVRVTYGSRSSSIGCG